jgi:hypothetical protein
VRRPELALRDRRTGVVDECRCGRDSSRRLPLLWMAGSEGEESHPQYPQVDYFVPAIQGENRLEEEKEGL